MRVAMLVGMLMFNVIASFYESGSALNVSPDAGLSDIQAMDEAPPPHSWP